MEVGNGFSQDLWGSFSTSMTHSANGPWKKSLNFIFPTKDVIPKRLKFSHWPGKMIMGRGTTSVLQPRSTTALLWQDSQVLVASSNRQMLTFFFGVRSGWQVCKPKNQRPNEIVKKTIFNTTHELEEFWQVLLAHQLYQCQCIIWCLANFSWSASELWISDCVDFLQTPSRCPHGFAKIPRRSCGISSPLNASSLEKYRYHTQLTDLQPKRQTSYGEHHGISKVYNMDIIIFGNQPSG